jgi:hypothetical protein
MGRSSDAALVLAGSLCALACEGCKAEKPYTPFGVTSALPDTPDPPQAPPSASSAPPPPRYAPAVVAPPGSRKLRLGSLTLSAPERYVFERALALTNGEQPQALAWVTPVAAASQGAPPMLVSYGAQGELRPLFKLPSFVPQAPGCKHVTRLQQTGSTSVLLDVEAECSTPLLARVPVQSVSVLAPAREAPEIITLRLAAPAPGESIAIEEDSTDRDGDGRDDVRVVFTLTAPSGATASAALVYLDRAAGASREAGEPRASLLELSDGLLKSAGTAGGAAAALGGIDASRRLLFSLCAEGGTPRVFDGEGTPIRCGELGGVIDRLARAEVLARLAKKDVLGAAAVLTRADWYFGMLSNDAQKSITRELNKRLLAVTPQVQELRARPRSARGPHWSPLWFEADGALLVSTDAGVVRVARDGQVETSLTGEPGGAGVDPAEAPWPLDVVDGGGKKLVGSLCVCDSSEVQLNVLDARTGPGPGIPTALLAPRPGGCRGRFECPDPVPLAVGQDGFSVLVAGSLVVSKADAPPLPSPGSARSPDGQWLTAKNPMGLLVLSEKHHELWQLATGPLDLKQATDCVVAGDRAAVACVVLGKAVMLRRP